MHSSILQGVLVGDGAHQEQVQSDVQEDGSHLERCCGQTAKQSGQLLTEVTVVQDLKLNAQHLRYTQDEVFQRLVRMLQLLYDLPDFIISLDELNKFFHYELQDLPPQYFLYI
jgi:hypothetical protein